MKTSDFKILDRTIDACLQWSHGLSTKHLESKAKRYRHNKEPAGSLIPQREIPDVLDSAFSTCRFLLSLPRSDQRFEAGDDVEQFLVDAALA
jgi:hypothetical protein